MQTTLVQRRDRGIALLIAVFALLLLSVIGLGMMYGTNMETAINGNYRDKQAAIYAAMAGLQEARDRIQPVSLNIVPPSVLPSLTANGVIYIINPKGGETVAPWDPSNRYADTELCQENVLGLSAGTPGVPCSGTGSLPVTSNTVWRGTPYDDSDTSSVWYTSNPLDFKWVRITLKKNNMTPVPATGSGSGTNQVCWDGRHQVMMPDGYGPDCVLVGSVMSIRVDAEGAGYQNSPPLTLTLDPPPSGGRQATAHPVMELTSNQSVDSVTIDPGGGGSGYNSQPDVSFVPVDGNGSGATGTVSYVPLGASIASVTLDTPGPGTRACYATAPAVAVVGGGGSGATATATLETSVSCIAAWNVTGKCASKKGQTVSGISLTGGSGSGFSGTISFASGSGDVTIATIENPGNGYTSAPSALGIGSCGGNLDFTPVLGRRVLSVSGSGGSGYTGTPIVTFTPGIGTTAVQPTATAALGPTPANAGQITGVTVTNGGSGYTSPPMVVFASATGMGASATAHLVTPGPALYKLKKVIVDDPGYGYTTVPGITFSGGGPGSGAAVTPTLGGGSSYGKVYLLTALAQTKKGGRAMLQMEVATPPVGVGRGAALVIDGPDPVMDAMPNSDEFKIDGKDANSCGQIEEPLKPAVGAYDDVGADPPTNSLETIVTALPRPDHYVGEGGCPDCVPPVPSVANVYSSLGYTLGTPQGLREYIQAVNSDSDTFHSLVPTSEGSPKQIYIDGDLTLNGNGSGYGLLVVTGTLTMSGDFSWHGAIIVAGDGVLDFSGGGTGTIVGTLIVAKIWDASHNTLPTMGSPTVHWNGGGNNGIYYDHCWATNMMGMVPIPTPPSPAPLRVLSLRNLPY
jgi:hypothetical protein